MRRRVRRDEGATQGRHWLMTLAIGMFGLGAALAVVGNSLVLRYGWHTNYSISRYVGLETWSTVVFMLTNMVVMLAMRRQLFALGEEMAMRKWYYWLVVAMLVALIGLSAFPVGYFDPVGADYASSTLSKVHEICARGMFIAMLIVTGVAVLNRRLPRTVRGVAGGFLVYGLFCLLGYLAKFTWFAQGVLVFESLYILGFMGWCWFYQTGEVDVTKRGRKVKDGKE